MCRCTFQEREVPKRAGFTWDDKNRLWITKSLNVAMRLEAFFDEYTKQKVQKVRPKVEQWVHGLIIPEGLELYPFQEEGCIFALSRKDSYLGYDMGLGKTPMAAVISATLDDHEDIGVAVLYICPPFLALNTQAEFAKWAPTIPLTIERKPDPQVLWTAHDHLVIPSSMVAKSRTIEFIKMWANHQRVMKKKLVLFIDEAHGYKNSKALRSQAVFGKGARKNGIASMFDRVIYMSGTPMPNRPIELFPVLRQSAHHLIKEMNKHTYGVTYCKAVEGEWGWDYNGGTPATVAQLKEDIKDFMLRKYRKDCFNIPFVEELVLLEGKEPPIVHALTLKVLKHLRAQDDELSILNMQKLLNNDKFMDLHLATYRRELGVAKVKPALNFILNEIQNSEDNFLIFTNHTEVIDTLASGLAAYQPLLIDGRTPMNTRHELVKEFQGNAERRVFLGNIAAAGTGLTLTKANRVIFAEFSWVPSDNDQARDRAVRIGQTQNVLVQYLAIDGSIDKAVITAHLSKKRIVGEL